MRMVLALNNIQRLILKKKPNQTKIFNKLSLLHLDYGVHNFSMKSELSIVLQRHKVQQIRRLVGSASGLNHLVQSQRQVDNKEFFLLLNTRTWVWLTKFEQSTTVF